MYCQDTNLPNSESILSLSNNNVYLRYDDVCDGGGGSGGGVVVSVVVVVAVHSGPESIQSVPKFQLVM